MYNKSQVFSTDIVIALVVFIVILLSSAWFWDMTKEKIHLTETRNDLKLVSRNAVSVLMNTVGDPPNWYNLSNFNDNDVYSLGIGKNRPWIVDEDKAIRLSNLNATNYSLMKRILGIRGASYEFFLNISKYNLSSDSFVNISLSGESPNATAAHVVRIDRFAVSDYDRAWIKLTMLVWSECEGAECY